MDLNETLSAARCRMKTTASVDEAVAAILKDTGAARYLLRAVVADDTTYEHRQEKRGRPGKDTRYRRIAHHRFSVTAHVDQEAVVSGVTA